MRRRTKYIAVDPSVDCPKFTAVGVRDTDGCAHHEFAERKEARQGAVPFMNIIPCPTRVRHMLLKS